MTPQDRAALFGTRAKRDDAEYRLQVAVVEHLKLRAMPDVVWYAVPNGEHRSKATGAKLKKMGVRPGVADLMLILPPEGHSAALELKVNDNRASVAQGDFAADCRNAGATYAIAWDIDQALAILEAWGAIHPEAEF